MPENQENQDQQQVEIPISDETKKAALEAIEKTKRVLSSMVERIFETQRKLGIWEQAEGSPEAEDLTTFMLDIHAKISSGYQALVSGGVLSDGEEEIELPQIFIETAIDLLGAARRFNVDVGTAFVDTVVEQAQEAMDPSKDEIQAELENIEKSVEQIEQELTSKNQDDGGQEQ